MNQNIWGNHAWFLLHSLSLNYPKNPNENDKRNMKQFLSSLAELLPCSVCKKHFRRNIRENPPDLESRSGLFKWMVDVHNEVNGRTGKKTWTYQQVLDHYNKIYDQQFDLNGSDWNQQNIINNIKLAWFDWGNVILGAIILYLIWLLFGRARGNRRR